jgi:hypothetical protein
MKKERRDASVYIQTASRFPYPALVQLDFFRRNLARSFGRKISTVGTMAYIPAAGGDVG